MFLIIRDFAGREGSILPRKCHNQNYQQVLEEEVEIHLSLNTTQVIYLLSYNLEPGPLHISAQWQNNFACAEKP